MLVKNFEKRKLKFTIIGQ